MTGEARPDSTASSVSPPPAVAPAAASIAPAVQAVGPQAKVSVKPVQSLLENRVVATNPVTNPSRSGKDCPQVPTGFAPLPRDAADSLGEC